jgi:hypothetical protein
MYVPFAGEDDGPLLDFDTPVFVVLFGFMRYA